MIRKAVWLLLAVRMVCPAQSVTNLDIEQLQRLVASGDKEQVGKVAERLISQAAAQPEALLALGQILGSHKEFRLAERAFARAAALLPDSFQAQFNLGFTLYQAQRAADAIAPLQKAATLQPLSFEANYLLGVALSQSNQKMEAIRRLRAARALRPEHAGLLAVLGSLYLESGYPLDAVEVLEPAQRQDPANLNVSLLLIQACHDSFDFDKALQLARQTAARFDTSADAHFRLGYELETAGNFAESEAALERALSLALNHPEAHVALGRLKVRQGRYAEAVRHLQAALQRNSADRQARLELAKALIGLKERDRAKEILLGLTTATPQDPVAHLLLSQIHNAEGNQALSQKERGAYLELTRRLSEAGGMSSSLAARRNRRYPAQ